MKKVILTLALLLSFSIVFTSCRDEKKTTEEKIETAIQEIEADAAAAGEEISDDVQDALEDVQDEIEEVKEESK